MTDKGLFVSLASMREVGLSIMLDVQTVDGEKVTLLVARGETADALERLGLDIVKQINKRKNDSLN